jgi:hypothetical protein
VHVRRARNIWSDFFVEITENEAIGNSWIIHCPWGKTQLRLAGAV